MRASFGGAGIAIRLNDRDKAEMDANLCLECIMSGPVPGIRPSVVLRVLDDKLEKDPADMEAPEVEPGWRIEGFPPDSTPETRERYEVSISREKYETLIRTGFIITRSMYDRISIQYWAPGAGIK